MKSSDECLVFLDSLVHVPGVAQACLVLPDRQVLAASATSTAMHNEAAWRTLQDMFKHLATQKLAAKRVNLVFGDWNVLALNSPELVCGIVMLSSEAHDAEIGVQQMFNQFVGA